MEKYFIPNISDIRVGYEFEDSHGQQRVVADFFHTGHKDLTPKLKEHEWPLSTVMNNLSFGYLKVPYLTKEQIENEGWKFIGKSIDIWFEKEGDFDMGAFTSYKIQIHYGSHDKKLCVNAIDRGEEYVIYRGLCNSINEFRMICKLLNI